ncbi:hypothetical protein DPMN_109313 [Dreissena polymorpha]|uniref:Uncharacterized protein n=1 Tax=Dreissena polymorpha TaxID=45954 RepID=A0A9D4KAI3_DREPO|nr:hypothetical protein DPMN_109313 [Dreissena polymorpha]
MPPYSAVQSLIRLVDCQLEYMLTAWTHNAELPHFPGKGCLTKDAYTGNVSYDFGKKSYIDEIDDLQIVEDLLSQKIGRGLKKAKSKRNLGNRTPQKEVCVKRKSQRPTPRKRKRSQCVKALQLQPETES